MTHRLYLLSGLFMISALPLLHAGVARAQQPSTQDSPKPVPSQSEPVKPAKSADQIKAGELFSEARKLVEAGDYKRACPKFEQSAALNLGIGVQFNLADCWEHIGRTASAQKLFQGAAASARAAGQADRALVAQARADALEPRLMRMVIDVKASDPELVVRQNRIIVDKKTWGAATPIDAGDYTIEAAAPGKKPWSARVIVPASASEPISILVPPLDAAPPEKQLTETPKPVPVKVPPPVKHVDPKAKRRTTYAYVIGGLGIASVGIGTFLAVKYKSKNSDAEAICPSSVNCSQADIDRHTELLSDAKAFRTGAFVGLGVGAAALITSAALFLAPSSSSGSASVRAAPFVTADGSWGAVAAGRF
jgi:hypothetical protein